MKPASPKSFTKLFLAYAEENHIEVITENIIKWDREHNNGKMRAAIVHKHGKQAIFEIGIKALFARYLYNPCLLRVPADKENPKGLKSGVKTFSGLQKGIVVSKMNKEQQTYLIEVQTERFKDSGTRLKLFGLPLKTLHEIVETL